MGRDEIRWVEVALWYANQGWHVLPFAQRAIEGDCACGSETCTGAHPRLPIQEATPDDRNIRAWGDLWEEGDVGVLLGSETGLIGLEIIGKKGAMTLKRLTKEVGALPGSLEIREGNRRVRFFAYPEASVPKAVEIGAGIRLLGRGQAVRLPPAPTERSRTALFWAKRPGLFGPSQFPIPWLEHAGIETAPVLASEGAAAQASSLPFRVLDAATLEGHARTRWVVRPFAAAGALTVVDGPPMSGKTSFLIQLARRVLEGPSLNGKDRGSVVYLTSEGPSTFARALLKSGLGEGALPALTVLHAEDVEEKPWGTLLRAVCEHCAAVGTRLLIVDGMERFAGARAPQDVDPAPLHRATGRGLSVVGACQSSPPKTGGANWPAALGPLGHAADTVLRLRRLPQHTRGRLEARSRFEEVPHQATYRLNGHGLEADTGPGPLFHASGAPPELRRPDPLVHALTE